MQAKLRRQHGVHADFASSLGLGSKFSLKSEGRMLFDFDFPLLVDDTACP